MKELKTPEADVHRYSVDQLFSKSLKNAQRNTWKGWIFLTNKVEICRSSISLKGVPGTRFFCKTTLREKYPYSNFFWSVFSPFSVRMWENRHQKNSEYGDFSRSATFSRTLLNNCFRPDPHTFLHAFFLCRFDI